MNRAGKITSERVLRDIEQGFSFRVEWAPDAVDALVADGLIDVRSGWVKPKGISRNAWRCLKKRGARSWESAKRRQDMARASLPCSRSQLAALLGLTTPGAQYVLERIGAVRVGTVREVDKLGRMRPRPLWGMK